MKKFYSKVAGAAVVGVALLGFAGMASALDINIYGASAQYLFWNDAADNFLTDTVANGGAGCSAATQNEPDSKHGVTQGTNCPTHGTINIRYTAKASYDGLLACQDKNYPGATAQCPNNDRQRLFADVGTTTLTCRDVTVAASDVAAKSFDQRTSLRNFKTQKPIDLDANGDPHDVLLPANQPLVVPFAFVVTNDVTVKQCMGPDLLEPTPSAHKAFSPFGNVCYENADCVGYYKCTDETCDGGVNIGGTCTTYAQCPDVEEAAAECLEAPLNNMTRLMATNIFSGKATNWKDFGDYFPNAPIYKCFRHAGSGTHATLDFAVMRGNGWGWDLQFWMPNATWSDGTGDLMSCMDTHDYAVGYADADRLYGKNKEAMHVVQYEGVSPTRDRIRNGLYNFWSAQWMYTCDDTTGDQQTMAQTLADYASDPDNIPVTKELFWAAKKEMRFMKSSDQAWSQKVIPALPQTP
ncbi:MAG: substrate-binding domain-containing protein [Thermodesulfobacteriota bacterium]|nr:substrate-binding domain-containing protein [Thermodesulfobacteriota bacterium]